MTDATLELIDEIRRIHSSMVGEAMLALPNAGLVDSVVIFDDAVSMKTLDTLRHRLSEIRDNQYAAIVQCRKPRHAHWDGLDVFTRKLPEQKALREKQRAFRKVWKSMKAKFDGQTATDRKNAQARIQDTTGLNPVS